MTFTGFYRRLCFFLLFAAACYMVAVWNIRASVFSSVALLPSTGLLLSRKNESASNSSKYLLLLKEPFYVYEELVWLDAQVDGRMPLRQWMAVMTHKYEEKHTDDYYFMLAALRHPMRTHIPEDAKLFVVPALFNFITQLLKYKEFEPYSVCIQNGTICNADLLNYTDKVLHQSEWFQKSQGWDHIAVATNPFVHNYLPDFEHIMNCHMIGMEDRNWNAADRFMVPSYYVGTACQHQEEKPHDFAMIARIFPNDWRYDDRQNICDWVAGNQTTSNFTMPVCGQGNKQCPALALAKFGFHAPGDTFGANRLMDTILSGTVPIFTYQEQYGVLPDWIDWDQLSFFADVTDREGFLTSLKEIVANEADYKLKWQNVLASRDLFDWKTLYPFDTYMYMFLRQLYPNQALKDRESRFPTVLTLDGDLRAFDAESKNELCMYTATKTCGECVEDWGQETCANGTGTCHWCPNGTNASHTAVDLADTEKCVPKHTSCWLPDTKD